MADTAQETAGTEPATEPTTETVKAAVVDEAEEEENKNVGDAVKKEEEAVESIYDSELPNRLIVGRNHPLSFYVDRARRVFRIEETVNITGRGDNISTACKLVEALKRQKIATIEKIATGMNVEPYFNSYGDAKWGQPTAVILFVLKRGEFGQFIADYQQRKIIEIFENNDEKSEGTLSVEKVESLEFATKFKANDQQIQDSKTFLSKVDDKTLDLPTFIKYASILIHPLLKNKIFKDILSGEFGIEVSGQRGGGSAAASKNEAATSNDAGAASQE